MKVLAVALALAALCAVGFALWGDRFDTVFHREQCAAWFARTKSTAWLAAIALLTADLVLPVPATGVMAALGSIYGVVVGAAVAATGSALAGVTGYCLARLAGKRAVGWIASEVEQQQFRGFFDRWGGAAVIVGRAMPVLPEVTSVLAGLAPMRFGRFVAALFLGTVPVAVLFAWVGHASADQPWWGVLVATGVPLLLWPVFLWGMRRRASRKRPQ